MCYVTCISATLRMLWRHDKGKRTANCRTRAYRLGLIPGVTGHRSYAAFARNRSNPNDASGPYNWLVPTPARSADGQAATNIALYNEKSNLCKGIKFENVCVCVCVCVSPHLPAAPPGRPLFDPPATVPGM